MAKRITQDSERDKAFIDAGFKPEKVGSVTIYKRPVSEDVIEASIQFSKRQIGYTSRDFPKKLSK
jgi:hypothetical protein